MSEILSVRHLSVTYTDSTPTIPAVNNVSLSIHDREIVGIAGESGCGKSTLINAILQLLPDSIVDMEGDVLLNGQNLRTLDRESMRRLRWMKISLVPQSAMNALNPIMTIEEQMRRIMEAHWEAARPGEIVARIDETLEMVNIQRQYKKLYPFELSGGMRQRVAIALALALRPDVVVMDEPTTGLDVIVQRGILMEIKRLQKQLGFAVCLVCHDMSLLIELAQTVYVMYAGRIIESGPSRDIYRQGRHPYTRGLIACFPPLQGSQRTVEGIPGSPPDLGQLPPGCAFHPRCPQAIPRCTDQSPSLVNVRPQHAVACHLHTPDIPSDLVEASHDRA